MSRKEIRVPSKEEMIQYQKDKRVLNKHYLKGKKLNKLLNRVQRFYIKYGAQYG